jgi:hypothetical protein
VVEERTEGDLPRPVRRPGPGLWLCPPSSSVLHEGGLDLCAHQCYLLSLAAFTAELLLSHVFSSHGCDLPPHRS